MLLHHLAVGCGGIAATHGILRANRGGLVANGFA